MWNYLRKHWKGLLVASLAITTAIICIYFPPTLLGFMIGGIASTDAFAILGAGALPGAAATVALVASATAAGLSALVIGCGSLLTRLCKRCCSSTQNDDSVEAINQSHQNMNAVLGKAGSPEIKANEATQKNQQAPFPLFHPGRCRGASDSVINSIPPAFN